MPTCGSLFSGAGLLDAALHLAGFEHAWFCEAVPERRELLRARFPGVPVYDDVRTVRGPFATDTFGYALREQSEPITGSDRTPVAGRASETTADADKFRGRVNQGGEGSRLRSAGRRPDTAGIACRVDLIAGGFPCKGASTAGKRNGFDHSETVLWHEMRRVIREVRPRYVLVENVANILGMAAGAMEPPGSLWGTVVGDLATLGFGDIRWDCVPAGAVGSPHLRDRVFCVASFTAGEDEGRNAGQREEQDGRADAGRDRDRASANAGRGGREAAECDLRPGQPDAERIAAADPDCARLEGHGRPGRTSTQRSNLAERGAGVGIDWGDYRPAIERWEAIHGPAPEPLLRRLDDGRADMQRMRARLDRQRLSALGDGVHVTVAYLVGLAVMHHIEHGRWA